MSASSFVKAGLITAGLSCLLLPNTAAAQQPITSPPNSNTPRAGQLGTPPPAVIPRDQPGQPYTARYGSDANASQPDQQVDHYLVNCLLQNNRDEIEISQFAAQRTKSSDVKQFAEQMVKDHQAFVQKLEPLMGMKAGAANRAGSSVLDANAPTGIDVTTTQATGGRPADGPLQPDGPTAGTRAPAGDLTRSATAEHNELQAGGALHQLAAIEQKINERCQQALREELEQKSGAEFDECFVGAQIAGHMHMLAALEVISRETQGPLKQAADEARPTVQKHLDHAKRWMQQAKAGGQTPFEAQRPNSESQRQ